ncbi:unnamed protein product [Calypogeia fissa]
MVAFPRSPPRLVSKPFSHAASFYATLGTLSVLLWVLGSYSNNSGLPTYPRFFSLKEIRHIASSYNKYTPLQAKKSREPAVSFYTANDIINALRSVTALAASSGPEVLFEEEEEDQWHMENPCRSRWELPIMYASRNVAQDLVPNPAWEEVFEEYTMMHRTCMSQMGNVTERFLSKNSNATGCKFLIVELPKVGFGNKILFKASAMLFSILTQRVILILDNLNITDHLCEPFVGSSWNLKDAIGVHDYRDFWHTRSDFQLWVDKTEYKNPTQVDELHAVDFGDRFQPLDRYYCNTEQAYMSRVPWISMSGCVYFLPKLFAIPAFRLALEDMFPDRMALTHVLRTVFLPSDHIWERIDDINDLSLRHTQSLVGVQLRYFQHLPQYKKMNDLVNQRVLHCVTTNKLLPTALPAGELNDYDHHQRNTSKVFIASLFPGLHDYLSEIYVKRMTATGDGLGLVQLTHESEAQHFGSEDVEAFVEIICLSLSDALLVTPVSTFGGLAQAYGALRPWFINVDDDGGPACARAKSVDVCFDQAAETFICPHDPDVHGLSVLDSVPYMQKCLKKESMGMQLVTEHESNPTSPANPSNAYT